MSQPSTFRAALDRVRLEFCLFCNILNSKEFKAWKNMDAVKATRRSSPSVLL